MSPNGKRDHVMMWSSDGRPLSLHSRSKQCEVLVKHWPQDGTGPTTSGPYTANAQGDLSVPLTRGWNRLDFKGGMPEGDLLVDVPTGALAMKGDPDPWPPPPPPGE